MIGNMITKIRKEKKITKTKLSELTQINTGHLTHIEKGERNPSHRALFAICKALNIPYKMLFNTYDKTLTDEQKRYNYLNYISYNQVPVFSNIDDYTICPSNYSNASFAYKIPDSSMSPVIEKESIVFIEEAALLNNKDIGLFQVNDKFLIRKFLYRKNDIILRAEDKSFEDIPVSTIENFKIIGKVYID